MLKILESDSEKVLKVSNEKNYGNRKEEQSLALISYTKSPKLPKWPKMLSKFIYYFLV